MAGFVAGELIRQHSDRLNAYWANEKQFVAKIAKALAPHFPDRYWEIFGPFGLSCEVVIHFYRQGSECPHEDIKGITFVPIGRDGDFSLAVKNYKANTGKYPAHSIGALNGMNHPDVEVPEGAGPEWFLRWIW